MNNKLNIDWDDFLTNYWQKKPVILRKAFSHFIDPITPDELEIGRASCRERV